MRYIVIPIFSLSAALAWTSPAQADHCKLGDYVKAIGTEVGSCDTEEETNGWTFPIHRNCPGSWFEGEPVDHLEGGGDYRALKRIANWERRDEGCRLRIVKAPLPHADGPRETKINRGYCDGSYADQIAVGGVVDADNIFITGVEVLHGHKRDGMVGGYQSKIKGLRVEVHSIDAACNVVDIDDPATGSADVGGQDYGFTQRRVRIADYRNNAVRYEREGFPVPETGDQYQYWSRCPAGSVAVGLRAISWRRPEWQYRAFSDLKILCREVINERQSGLAVR